MSGPPSLTKAQSLDALRFTSARCLSPHSDTRLETVARSGRTVNKHAPFPIQLEASVFRRPAHALELGERQAHCGFLAALALSRGTSGADHAAGAGLAACAFAQKHAWPTTVPDDPFRPPATMRRTSALATERSSRADPVRRDAAWLDRRRCDRAGYDRRDDRYARLGSLALISGRGSRCGRDWHDLTTGPLATRSKSPESDGEQVRSIRLGLPRRWRDEQV